MRHFSGLGENRNGPAMSNRVKVGVLGVGSVGECHARIYSETPSCELLGVYDVNQERAEAVARRCGVKSFKSIEEFSETVQAASIAVPTNRHYEIAVKLLERGVHALVEKPIAASTVEAEEMVAIAEARSVILQVGHVERFNPVMRFLEQTLAAPRFVEAIRLAPFPPPRQDAPPRGTEVSVIFDLMIHDLEIILHLVRSAAKEVHAVGVPVLSGSEDIANARLLFENGCVANVTASRISQESMRKIRVFQEDTYVSLDYRQQSGRLVRKAGNEIKVEAVPIAKAEPLRLELESFVECVATQGQPLVSGRHASDALKLAVAISRSIRSGPS